MARCWTCHRRVAGFRFTCPACEGCGELRKLQKTVAQSQSELSGQLANLEQSVQSGFHELSDSISSGFRSWLQPWSGAFKNSHGRLPNRLKLLRSLTNGLRVLIGQSLPRYRASRRIAEQAEI